MTAIWGGERELLLLINERVIELYLSKIRMKQFLFSPFRVDDFFTLHPWIESTANYIQVFQTWYFVDPRLKWFNEIGYVCNHVLGMNEFRTLKGLNIIGRGFNPRK